MNGDEEGENIMRNHNSLCAEGENRYSRLTLGGKEVENVLRMLTHCIEERRNM